MVNDTQNESIISGDQTAQMMQDCQPGWQPGMPCMQKRAKQEIFEY